MGDRMKAEQGWASHCTGTVSQLLLSNDSLLTLRFRAHLQMSLMDWERSLTSLKLMRSGSKLICLQG